ESELSAPGASVGRLPEMLTSVSCPQGCTCEYLAVNCTGKGLAEFPATIPLDTRQLILLNFLSDLIYLDCSGNALGQDLDFTFVSIISLVVLKLSDNPGLVEIEKDSFANNTWLRHLDVSRCSLTFLDAITLRDLPNLRSLGLSGNPWFCNCSFMELQFCFPLMSHNSPYSLATMLEEAQEQLNYKCFIHFDDQDYLFLGLVGFCIFSAGTVFAWLLGVCAAVYEFLTALECSFPHTVVPRKTKLIRSASFFVLRIFHLAKHGFKRSFGKASKITKVFKNLKKGYHTACNCTSSSNAPWVLTVLRKRKQTCKTFSSCKASP
uniref:LRRNT domain-containing protein n=1 Tax=Podarcis muralis TaxID=64176 RepID=A0A670IBP2_PODMU